MNTLALASQTESKDIKVNSKKTLDSKNIEEENLFEDIISELVMGEENEEDGSFLLSKLLNLSSDVEKDEKISSDFSKGNLFINSQEEKITIQDLLQISLNIKDGKDPATFPTDSKSLKIALSKPDIIDQFKGAKNINELLDVAKKNNIEVKNFQFFQEEAALNPKDKKIIQKVKSEDIFKLIQKQPTNKNTQILSPINNTKDFVKNEKSDTNILQTILSSEISSKTPLKTIKDESKIVKTDKIEVDKKTSKTIIKDTRTINKNTKIIDIDTKSQIPKDNSIQVISKEKIEHNEEIKPIKTTIIEKTINEKTINEKIKEIKVQKDNKNNIDQKIDKQSKTSVELEDTKQNNIQSNFKNKLQNIIQTSINDTLKTDTQKEQSPIKNQNIDSDLDLDLEDHTKTISSTEHKTISVEKVKNESHEVKKTFNTFAQEFKEKVENYKPPLMKIKMELKPTGLGEVDVTLLSRGNNLQVNINSNANTIAIFTQNQVEFKNSLVNMGFSDLQMNFGDNHKKEQDQQKQNSKNSFEQFEEEQTEQDGFEITIPRYI